MVLPSLILRLEKLTPPHAPASGDEAQESGDEASAPGEAPESGEAVRPAQGAEPRAEHEQPAVDVAAAERRGSSTSLNRWSAAVAAAHDGCFLLDERGMVISVSVAAVELLGSGDLTIIGRHILDAINLVDLETGAGNPEYAPRITPLVVLESPGLARSLMRVRHQDGAVVTLDTSSVPIHGAAGNLLGSLTFVAPIPAR